MGYGGFDVGSGASSYDLDRLAAEIISGDVNAPLTTNNGEELFSRDGVAITAYAVRSDTLKDESVITAAVAGLMRAVDANQAECLTMIYAILASIISGVVYAPLLTADGKQLYSSARIPLAALKNL